MRTPASRGLALLAGLALMLTACPGQETTTEDAAPETEQQQEEAPSPLESWPELDAVVDAFGLNDEGKQAIANAVVEDPEGDQVAPFGELAPAPGLDIVRGVAFIIDLSQEEVDRLFNTSVFPCGTATLAEFPITTICGGETVPPGPMLVAMLQSAAPLDVSTFAEGDSFEIALAFANPDDARNYQGREGDYHTGATLWLGIGNHSGTIEATGRVWDGRFNEVQPNLRGVLFGETERFGGQETQDSYSGFLSLPYEHKPAGPEFYFAHAQQVRIRPFVNEPVTLATQGQNRPQTEVGFDGVVLMPADISATCHGCRS